MKSPLSKASPTVPIEATSPESARVSPNRTDVYCEPASELSRIRLNTDHGTQFTSWVFGEKIRAAGLLPSFGTIGDGLDKSLAS